MRKQAIALAGAAVLALGAAVAQPGPMMGGYGPGGMMGGYGPGGMMGGYGYGHGLPELTSEQRTKIAEIQREQRARQWPLMQQMQELMWADTGGSYDEQAQRRDYDKLAGLHKQMFETSLETRKRIESVLTPQQREEWRRGGRGGR